MTIKQYAGGLAGAFIGLFIDIGVVGFAGGYPWFTLVGIIIGGVILTSGNSSRVNKEENFDDYIRKYKNIYCKLPKGTVASLGGIVSHTITALGLSPQETPEELLKLGAALATIQDENLYGTISLAQGVKINELITDFSKDLSIYVPILNKHMDAAMDKGLDFGIIGGAADVALYNVMDTMEKRKNLRIANSATNQIIDKRVIELTTSIQNALL